MMVWQLAAFCSYQRFIWQQSMFCCRKISRSGSGNSPLFWMWLSCLNKSGKLCFNAQDKSQDLISALSAQEQKNTLTKCDIFIHRQILNTSDVTVNNYQKYLTPTCSTEDPTSSSYLPDTYGLNVAGRFNYTIIYLSGS